MKKLSILLGLTLLASLTVRAQGPIQVINPGTNLAVVGLGDTTNTPIIAYMYDGLGNTVQNNGGASNVIIALPPSGQAYTIFTNSSGGISVIQKPTLAPSGYRVGASIYNTNLAVIGIKLSGNYPTNAVPDRLIPSFSSVVLYFEDGYNGPISARAVSSNAVAGALGVVYSEWGN